MLRGNHLATVDEKGRLKIPAAFLDSLRELGNRFFVTSENAIDARANHVEKRVLAQLGIAGVVQGEGELPRQANLFIELPQGQQPGIARQLGLRGFDEDGQLTPKIEACLPSSLYKHSRPPFACYDLSLQQVRRDRRPFSFMECE